MIFRHLSPGNDSRYLVATADRWPTPSEIQPITNIAILLDSIELERMIVVSWLALSPRVAWLLNLRPTMPLIKDVIRRFFPEGTNLSPASAFRVHHESKWRLVPSWPPDLFAVSARLVEWSGCYAGARYAGWDSGSRLFSEDSYRANIESVASRWRGGQASEELQKLWECLLAHEESEICLAAGDCQLWRDAAITLMAIADHASAGIGFVGEPSLFPDMFLTDYGLFATGRRDGMFLNYLPHSLCAMVPHEEACVQPKTMTPRPGCTLRSFSHHLALLPPIGEVKTSWAFSVDESVEEEGPLNLLLVPFPYNIADGCVVQGHVVDGPNTYGFFEMNQLWLESNGATITADQIARFLADLIQEAESKHSVVNGLVMPELALDRERAQAVARSLAELTNLELCKPSAEFS